MSEPFGKWVCRIGVGGFLGNFPLTKSESGTTIYVARAGALRRQP
jgi:hypothetical protein